MTSRIICIGDIHGCSIELSELLNKLDLQDGDKLCFLGDLVDKGPYPHDVLSMVEDLLYLYPGSVALLGNHDKTWLRHPERYGVSEEGLIFLRTLPLFARKHGLFLVHAGIYPAFETDFGPLLESDAALIGGKRGRAVEKFAHVRMVDTDGSPVPFQKEDKEKKYWASVYDGRYGLAVFGHTVFDGPFVSSHAIGIDTGCVYGGLLTSAVFDVEKDFAKFKEFVFVRAKKKYCT